MDRLLEGVRVVELSTLIAGPFCGLTLLDLGADVVKVEPPRGDDARTFPPLLPDGGSAFFHALNRGKRGAVLDLAVAEDREAVRRLIERADVVVDNLGEAAAQLGFGREEALGWNERLVWCSVTGTGVGRGGRTLDPTLQASMGLMALTGEPGGPPLRVPVPLVDFMTGMYAAQSVITALWRVERSGRGALLDCAMVDAAATLTSLTALLGHSGDVELGRIGSQSYLAAPSAVFATADGEYVQVVAVSERHWAAVCRALGHPEWLDDPRCADAATRLANRDHVHGLVAEAIAGGDAGDWVERIGGAGGLCERVRGMEEAWADPLLADRGLVGSLGGGSGAAVPLPLVSLARTADSDALVPGPALGEHTEAILRELG